MVTLSVLFVCFFFGVFDHYIMFLRQEDKICEFSGLHLPQVGYSKTRWWHWWMGGWRRKLEQFVNLFPFSIVDGETEMHWHECLVWGIWGFCGHCSSESIFEWCMTRLAGKNKHWKYMCTDDDIGESRRLSVQVSESECKNYKWV